MSIIEQNELSIKKLCEVYNVQKLYAFGSSVTKNFNDTSDVDFIVDFKKLDAEEYTDNYFSLKFALESLLKRNIDLLEDKAIKNPFLKKSIDASKKLVYG